jgi:hypothetical protein
MSEERSGSQPADDTDELDLIDEDEEAEEAAPEEEPGEPAEPSEHEPPPRQSRQQRRDERTRLRLREVEEENRRLREQLIAPRQPAYQPPDPYRQHELERQEFERVSQMPFEEQARYWPRKAEERMTAQLNLGRREIADMIDRNSFDQYKASNAIARKYADQVEQALHAMQNRGLNPTRKEVLAILAWPEIERQMERQTTRQRQNGQRRIASQTTQPGTGRSTAASPRQGRSNEPSAADDEALLKSVTLGDVW